MLLVLLLPPAGPPAAAGLDVDLYAFLSARLPFPIYPLHLPQQSDPAVEVMPAYVYTLTDADHLGNLGGPAGLAEAHYRITAWSYLHDDAVAMAEAIRPFNGFRGPMGATTVRGVFLHDQAAEAEAPADAGDRWTYSRMNEFRIFYLETTATF